MRLVGTKMDSFGTQGIKFKRRITWYPQGQLIITEAKLQDVRPTILATVQILCAPGDSRLDFHISSGSLIVLSIFLFLILSYGSLVCQYWLETPLLNAGMRAESFFNVWVQIGKFWLWTDSSLVHQLHTISRGHWLGSTQAYDQELSSEINFTDFRIHCSKIWRALKHCYFYGSTFLSQIINILCCCAISYHFIC